MNDFEKVTENDFCEFGHWGLSNVISEHIQKLKEDHFCLVARNKETKEISPYLIFDKKSNIIKAHTDVETLLCWIDMLLLGNEDTNLTN